MNLVYIDLERSIEEQMPFDLIVHKMSDIHGKMLHGDTNEKVKFERFLVCWFMIVGGKEGKDRKNMLCIVI